MWLINVDRFLGFLLPKAFNLTGTITNGLSKQESHLPMKLSNDVPLPQGRPNAASHESHGHRSSFRAHVHCSGSCQGLALGLQRILWGFGPSLLLGRMGSHI